MPSIPYGLPTDIIVMLVDAQHITANAYAHALRVIAESYPDLPKERQEAQAAMLAAKICKKEKR